MVMGLSKCSKNAISLDVEKLPAAGKSLTENFHDRYRMYFICTELVRFKHKVPIS